MSTHLQKYIDRKNMLNTMFGGEAKPMPKTAAECKYWFDLLEGDLSPENLHCDGEISHSAAMAKKRKLDAAWRELEIISGKEELIA